MHHKVLNIAFFLISIHVLVGQKDTVYSVDELFILTETGDSVNHIDINGLRQGRFLEWRPHLSGKGDFVWKERHYMDGVLHGKGTDWNDYGSGVISREFNYVNGELDGNFKVYWPNGKLRMEFEMRDGVKQGIDKSYYTGGKRLWSKGQNEDGFWVTDTVCYRFFGVRYLRDNPVKETKSTYHEWMYDRFHIWKRSRDYVEGDIIEAKYYLFGMKFKEKKYFK